MEGHLLYLFHVLTQVFNSPGHGEEGRPPVGPHPLGKGSSLKGRGMELPGDSAGPTLRADASQGTPIISIEGTLAGHLLVG